jgi:eukaryotic-like serine/threonine-protein kinase
MRETENRFFRILILFSFGTLALAFLLGVLAFVLSLEGREETMVPDLEGMELANAVIELQDKGLYAEVQLRYSNSLSDKGTVLGQEPIPGSVLKAGSEVLLRVSKGAAVEKLENYVGLNINELEARLKSLESVYGPLLRLKTPLIRVYDESPRGTILEQKPKPGTELSVLTELELVVSKGPEGQMSVVRDYTGLDWRSALQSAASSGHPFVFTRTNDPEGSPGTVVSQSPKAEAEVPVDTIRQLLVRPPQELEEGYRFGILEKELPDQPLAIPIQIEAISPTGEQETLIGFRHAGGLLTVPYLQKIGTSLIVLIDGQERIRVQVREEE